MEVVCPKCGTHLEFPGQGIYTCSNCGEDIEILPPEITDHLHEFAGLIGEGRTDIRALRQLMAKYGPTASLRSVIAAELAVQ
jgi:DNA-directed RNA polymerase subunit RPC12/RpoP